MPDSPEAAPLDRKATRRGGCAAVLPAVLLILLGSHVIGSAVAADIFSGKRVFEAHCANCHGIDGFPTVPGTPDFTRGESLLFPDVTLIESIKLGKQLMPGYNRVISEKDILDVVSFIRTLRR